jgi:Transposase DDE domain group 1
LSKDQSTEREGTSEVNGTRVAQRVKVTGDGTGVASHAGSLLLAELADRVGLTAELASAMAHTRRRRSAHDPGVVLTQLAVMLADGGDCLADIAVLRRQPELFGRVGSDPTVWRVLDSIHSLGLRNIEAARAAARARAWAAGAAPDEFVIDIDGTLVDAHSDKQDATPTYKRGFGFYPILAYLDASGEGLAGMLRPGRAGSNNAADHLAVLDAALAQLPVSPAESEIVVRTDTAGATHDFIDGCSDRGVGFLVGLPIDAAVRDAFMLVQEEDWVPAIETDGTRRDGAWLVELTDLLDHHWGDDVRVIARRERPHPGAQLTLFDTAEGFRHQVFITDQTEADIAALELRHRHRAHVENRIRAAKDTGLRNLPCEDFVRNQAWLQLVLIAQDLHAWAQALCFDGELAVAEPKKLRHRVWHAAAVIAHTGRQTIVRFQRSWPWTTDIVIAFHRLRVALPD